MDAINKVIFTLEQVRIGLDSIAVPELSDEIVRVALPSLRSTLDEVKEDVKTMCEPLVKHLEEENAQLAARNQELNAQLAATNRTLTDERLEKDEKIQRLQDRLDYFSEHDLKELIQQLSESHVPAKRKSSGTSSTSIQRPVSRLTGTTAGSTDEATGASTPRRAASAVRETTTGTPDISGDTAMFEDDTTQISDDLHTFQDEPSKPTDDDICAKLVSEFECPITLPMNVFRTQLLGLVQQYESNEGAVREHIDKAAMGPVLSGQKDDAGWRLCFFGASARNKQSSRWDHSKSDHHTHASCMFCRGKEDKVCGGVWFADDIDRPFTRDEKGRVRPKSYNSQLSTQVNGAGKRWKWKSHE